MSEGERPLVEELLDYAVFAPLGLAITIAEDLPGLVRKGRARIGTQVGVARFVGRVAAGRARHRLEDLLAPNPESPTAPSTPPQARPREQEPMTATVPSPLPSDLAIPGYDSLTASQVAARLPGLNVSELEAVAAYEAAHRARRTVLARIEQLRGNEHA